jgi:hypothetical protein
MFTTPRTFRERERPHPEHHQRHRDRAPRRHPPRAKADHPHLRQSLTAVTGGPGSHGPPGRASSPPGDQDTGRQSGPSWGAPPLRDDARRGEAPPGQTPPRLPNRTASCASSKGNSGNCSKRAPSIMQGGGKATSTHHGDKPECQNLWLA